MQTFLNDPDLLNYLRAYKVPVLTRKKFDSKFFSVSADDRMAGSLMSARDHLREQPLWCEAMAAVVRNAPDERNMTITVLPNRDTLAALLAVRLGIDMHLAVALALGDMIMAWAVNDGSLQEISVSPDDAVVLATFSRAGESNSSLALTARRDARTFKLRFAPEELMLFDQHPEVGLHLPFRADYFEGHFFANQLVCRSAETVFYRGERDLATLFDIDVMTALQHELSTLTYTPSGSADTAERYLQRQLQAVIDKHLGEGVCTAAVCIDGEPVRLALADDGELGGYPYLIEGISWPDDDCDLPDEAEVVLPSELVHAGPEEYSSFGVFELFWEQTILAALTSKFGVCPVEIGGYEPVEED